MKLTAETRTSVHRDHALIAPDGWVANTLPGWDRFHTHVIISPAMGARFTQMLIISEENGHGGGLTGTTELFLFTMEGKGQLKAAGDSLELSSGAFAFLPPETEYEITGTAGLKLTVFEKIYHPIEGHGLPEKIYGHQSQVKKEVYLNDPQLRMHVLLPATLDFDMAVNVFTYDPGGNLPFVETHVMEHGLIYLQGQGIYRLADRWYPVGKDDCIWMAPYCPQWFVAMGKEPAVYLYYKDVNRHPLAH